MPWNKSHGVNIRVSSFKGQLLLGEIVFFFLPFLSRWCLSSWRSFCILLAKKTESCTLSFVSLFVSDVTKPVWSLVSLVMRHLALVPTELLTLLFVLFCFFCGGGGRGLVESHCCHAWLIHGRALSSLPFTGPSAPPQLLLTQRISGQLPAICS